MKNYNSPAILMLEDGTTFYGMSIGANGIATGEVVFNTAMTGYQEVLTDPSYAQQIITFTSPHIGNTGINDEDMESNQIWANAIIIKKSSLTTSNWRAQKSLQDYLIENNKIGIAEIDTRKLTRHLSQHGSMSACIMAGSIHVDCASKLAKNFKFEKQDTLIQKASTQSIYTWNQGSYYTNSTHLFSQPYHIVVYDFGVKQGILRALSDLGCRVTVVPANTSIEKILFLQADAVVLSNGPGNPIEYPEGIKLAEKLITLGIPLFGICFGHQLIALAAGAKIIKMKQGHHGINHPVIDLKTKKVFISSQNHNFTVAAESLPKEYCVTHISLFDHTVQGIAHLHRPIFSLQGHPEAHPGPIELTYYFNEFLTVIKTKREYYVKAN